MGEWSVGIMEKASMTLKELNAALTKLLQKQPELGSYEVGVTYDYDMGTTFFAKPLDFYVDDYKVNGKVISFKGNS